jgi:hypothetical protein
MDHYHLVRMPGEQGEEQYPCPHVDTPENPCRFSQGTPEELGRWLTESTPSKTRFLDWLQVQRGTVPAEKSGTLVDPSIAEAIRDSIRNPKTTRTVPVTVENDHQKWVVGEAEVEIKDGNVHVSATLLRGALYNHVFSSDLGPFSITTEGTPLSPAETLRAEGVIPLEATRVVMCTDRGCKTDSVHIHGSPCTAECSCNRHGRVD